MSAETTQPSLLSRVRDPDDQVSWREFDGKYRDLILRFCRARGLQPADAEDVRQLVMMGLARSLRNFKYKRDLGRFRDYLGRVVRNAITRFVSCPTSARKTLYPAELDSLPDPRHDNGDEAWEREWMHHHFRQAMRKCKQAFEPQSIAIFEQLLAGHKTADVAVAFAVTPAAVYKVKQRLRDHLHTRVAEQIREEEFPERAD